MGLPTWTGWALVGLATATGLMCLNRARVMDDRGARRTACSEAVMGFGMALMAAPGFVAALPLWGPVLLVVVFGAVALRVIVFARGEGHRLHHGVEAVAMVYMAVVMLPAVMRETGASMAAGVGGADGMSGMSDMSGMAHGHGMGGGGMGVPWVNALMLGYFAAYVVWAGVRLVPVPVGEVAQAGAGGGGRPAPVSVWRAHALGDACRLSLGMGMLVMTLAM
ncbi:DUF5134 domain-containing protein [Streptomyces beihaiensis]|uniref:DUF5134 domain-containing protein n=1 Tax=Streptomyces beihaiensis TaxID=2984495 RepID=A0ABT3TPI5_9ACTN|nr:DUF5134 domain-containing protein [Streptomyces beihaiensis]MCX3058943.1 DUF5134 domain-containing protein [Streptomyces beihaiensis]